MGGSSNELQDLTNILVARVSAYGMEVSTEKSKVMVNGTNEISVNITMNGESLKEVTVFKCLGATLSKDGTSRAKIRVRIATATAVSWYFTPNQPLRLYQGDTATAAMVRLNRVWKSNISFQTKFQLFRSLVVFILLYRCEAWTLLADDERRIQAFETKCLRKLLRISYRKHETNDYVRSLVKSLVGPQEPLLATVRRL